MVFPPVPSPGPKCIWSFAFVNYQILKQSYTLSSASVGNHDSESAGCLVTLKVHPHNPDEAH